MANEVKPAAKQPKIQPSLSTRISDQLNRAVLARKITREELAKLSAHIERLAVVLES